MLFVLLRLFRHAPKSKKLCCWGFRFLGNLCFLIKYAEETLSRSSHINIYNVNSLLPFLFSSPPFSPHTFRKQNAFCCCVNGGRELEGGAKASKLRAHTDNGKRTPRHSPLYYRTLLLPLSLALHHPLITIGDRFADSPISPSSSSPAFRLTFFVAGL